MATAPNKVNPIKLNKILTLIFIYMTFSLNTIILEPLSKEKPKNAVILCHGYGGDGKDISILASYWRAQLKQFLFVQMHQRNVLQVPPATNGTFNGSNP